MDMIAKYDKTQGSVEFIFLLAGSYERSTVRYGRHDYRVSRHPLGRVRLHIKIPNNENRWKNDLPFLWQWARKEKLFGRSSTSTFKVY